MRLLIYKRGRARPSLGPSVPCYYYYIDTRYLFLLFWKSLWLLQAHESTSPHLSLRRLFLWSTKGNGIWPLFCVNKVFISYSYFFPRSNGSCLRIQSHAYAKKKETTTTTKEERLGGNIEPRKLFPFVWTFEIELPKREYQREPKAMEWNANESDESDESDCKRFRFPSLERWNFHPRLCKT